MSTSESTCWIVIRAAAAGSAADRDELARRYLGAEVEREAASLLEALS